MMFPAISRASWWRRLVARLFGRKRIAYDKGVESGDYSVYYVCAEFCGRLYILSEHRGCKHRVCRLSCYQNGGCKVSKENQ